MGVEKEWQEVSTEQEKENIQNGCCMAVNRAGRGMAIKKPAWMNFADSIDYTILMNKLSQEQAKKLKRPTL